jgi:hypothetical protein
MVIAKLFNQSSIMHCLRKLLLKQYAKVWMVYICIVLLVLPIC